MLGHKSKFRIDYTFLLVVFVFSQIVSELLACGGCPNVRTNGGTTPAHRAAYKGHKEVLDILLSALRRERFESVADVDDDGDTIAHKVSTQRFSFFFRPNDFV